MPIQAPRSRSLSHGGLRWRPRGKKKPVVANLQLTPLIDALLVVLFFLLYRFEASGSPCGCPPWPLVPMAERAEQLDRAPVIVIPRPDRGSGSSSITLDGAVMASVEEVGGDDSPDGRIGRLTEQLAVKRHSWTLARPGEPFSGEVIIAADEEVDAAVLKKVLYSCGRAGYGRAQLAVRPGAPDGSGPPSPRP